ncbi:hypothetical protein HAX54_052665 [Datura stramonium]|uniref:Uncharacterized protein n=1 Tax=Datura stramonium TaxID=4076 RepID=A0ABS8WNN1_DATST|nr:hypothetical protein [Datura stramonium]
MESVQMHGRMVDISKCTIQQFLFGPNYMASVNTIEFDYKMHVVCERKKQDDKIERTKIKWLALVLTDKEPAWLRDDTVPITKDSSSLTVKDQPDENKPVGAPAPTGEGAATPSEPPATEVGTTTFPKAALAIFAARPPVSALANMFTRKT